MKVESSYLAYWVIQVLAPCIGGKVEDTAETMVPISENSTRSFWSFLNRVIDG